MIKMQYILLVLGMLFWGGNFAVGKAINGSIPPLTMSYIRWIIAIIFFLPFCWEEIKAHREVLIKKWKIFSVLGVAGPLGFNMCVYLSLNYTTVINSSIINAFAPIAIMIMSYLFLKEKIVLKQIMGIALSLFGVIWIIAKGDVRTLTTLNFNTGDIVMLLGVMVWAIYSTLLKVNSKIAPQKVIFAASMLGGLVFTLPLILIELSKTGLVWLYELKTIHFLSLLYIGIFPSILSFLFFNKGVIELGASRAGIFLNLTVVFASIFGVLFLGESFMLPHLIGGFLIVGGVILSSTAKTSRIMLSRIISAKK